MWYFGVFLAEIDGLLQIIKYLGLIAIAAAAIHIIISLGYLIVAGILMLIGGIGIGILLVKSGAVQITTQLNNSQNPELMEIHKKINGK